ncbi:2-C-methyl-D-erythritol 4-phosphate cytidylyltransferase [Sphingobium sp. SCG-1]|uniref:bifunctional cytidylyltransferase/SDR family oxidoreductase n=1 Tax=Sphingobium sp. SCG-1 TaxID=2072936 RepID=UPI000CD68F6A|nr:bifunctional cytidylyltransferase/SDR family oxidoreductase [Sphingobium sp. SCG-1]AUW57280.1 2-C-methyl-D-erythritol 4-phosphate cytidylyltransferase [Sphingobium sp. SCG-1]
MSRSIAIILASGTGERSGLGRPKQLVKLAGRPVIAHAMERFQGHRGIDEIAIVTNQACLSEIKSLIIKQNFTKVKRVLLGGKERYESSLAAIRAYANEDDADDLNLIFHDAVRPLVSERMIGEVLDALQHYSAVDVAIPSADTVVLIDGDTNTIREIPDRRKIRLGQTPQAFKLPVIKAAYDRALMDPDFRTTDDCGVVLRYSPEVPIYVATGAPSNVKLTYPDDLMLIDKLMQTNAGRRLDAVPETTLLARLQGQTIAIFGGTSGIGASMARMATAYGANVHVASKSTGVDIADAASIERFLDSVVASDGRIDAIVNAAAVLNRQPLMNMTEAQVVEDVNTNILGAVLLARLGYRHLVRHQGHLLFFASSSYTYGRAFYSTYSASKAAVVNLTQALGDEWADARVHVNCVNPERTQTPMRVKAFGYEPPETLLNADEVARKALGILVTDTTGFVYDIVKQDQRIRRAAVDGAVEPDRLPAFVAGAAG